MEKDQAIKKLYEILEQSRFGVMSTIHGNKPNARYMTFYNDDELLYTKTDVNSLKVKEIDKNRNTHVLLGYDETSDNSFIEIDGYVEIVEDQAVIDMLWKEQDKTFFDSKEDPDLVVLRIVPRHIKIMNTGEEPKILEF